MKFINKRGRPQDNDVPILKYTQNFKDYNGCKYTWVWDKNISPHAPLSVSIDDPQYNVSEKLLRELEKLNEKYTPKKGDRKPRITKADKARMDEIQHELEEFHYSLYPEDRVFTKKRGRKPKTIKL